MTSSGGFILLAPKVLEVRAEYAPPEVEPHLKWTGTVSGPQEDEDGMHVVFATLHGAWADARAEVTLGLRFKWLGEAVQRSGDELLEALKASSALETAYDFARAVFLPVIGFVDGGIDVPMNAPDAALTIYDASIDDGEGATTNESRAALNS